MSDRNESGPKLDSDLSLSPQRVANERLESPTQSATLSSASQSSSSVSTGINQEDNNNNHNDLKCSNNPKAISTVLIGCLNCLMYTMIPKDDLTCPVCKSTIVLLDFLQDDH